jgi:hypothetical protein
MAARAKLQNEIHDFGWCKKVQVGSTSDYLNYTVQEVKGRKHGFIFALILLYL